MISTFDSTHFALLPCVALDHQNIISFDASALREIRNTANENTMTNDASANSAPVFLYAQ